MNLRFAGVSAGLHLTEYGSYFAVMSETPLYALNSSVIGGGFGYRKALVNRQVDKAYASDDPAGEMSLFLEREGIDSASSAGMLTAAHVRDTGFSAMCMDWEDDNAAPDPAAHAQAANAEAQRLDVCSWVTVGLGNPARAGEDRDPEELYPGTINMIVVVDAVLSDAAMINAVMTATEAKAALLQDLGIVVPASGRIATGTTTDAVIFAATQQGLRCSYAGTATRLGYLVGKTVYDAAHASASAYLRRMPETGS